MSYLAEKTNYEGSEPVNKEGTVLEETKKSCAHPSRAVRVRTATQQYWYCFQCNTSWATPRKK